MRVIRSVNPTTRCATGRLRCSYASGLASALPRSSCVSSAASAVASYRLAVFAIRLPPLRERKADIPALCEALLRQIAASFSRPPAGIVRPALDLLLAHDWPGNVRELRNVLERAAILCEGGLITADHLAFVTPDVDAIAAPGTGANGSDLRVIEKATIVRALADAQYNKSLAARRLGLSRKQLYVRLRQHGL